MTSISFIFSMLVLTVAAMGSAHAQSSTDAAVMVGVDNFARAETDLYMGKMVSGGSLGKFAHSRAPADIATQDVVRMNRDTLYSSAVFDLDAGPRCRPAVLHDSFSTKENLANTQAAQCGYFLPCIAGLVSCGKYGR